ncbi:MAG: NAD(P)-dependent oxidoreductase [Pseudomonadota bacterium]
MKLGFIGLGNLGALLAGHLVVAGQDVTVFDLDEEAVAGLAAMGARPGASVADAATDADALITCLPSPAATGAVVLGEDGAFAAMTPGSLWIEMSTLGVEDIKRFAASAGERGIAVLEAPLTGGLHRAARGEMTILTGGEKAVLGRCRPALEIMGGQIIHMGPLGSAALVKVISNMLCLIDLVAAGEALALAKAGGLDLAKTYEAICASSGSSREFEDWAPVILNGSYNTGFTLDLGLKDLGFVAGLGEKHNIPLKLNALVKRLFEEARETHGGNAWTPHVVKMIEDETGQSLRAAGFGDVIPKND